MRVLFGEQLSEALLHHLSDLSPGAVHVRLLGLGGAGDDVIWQRATELQCVLVTKDEDFHRRSVLTGAPPKVVWIRLGNWQHHARRHSPARALAAHREVRGRPVVALLELA